MKEFLEELLVVLVIYKMKIEESPAYHSLTRSLVNTNDSASLYIFDNSPEAQQIPVHVNWSIHYFHDPSNLGVSKAYNEGFVFAKHHNKKWMLLVDQDTHVPTNCFDEYFRAAKECSIIVPMLQDKFGVVSPLKFHFGGGKRIKPFKGKKILKLRHFFFHNSGLLVATEVFEKAGGYDENLRLDFSDFAFVHRLRQRHNEFALADFSCTHGLATSEVASLDERLYRFESYISSAKYFKSRYTHSDGWIKLRVLLRGVKFCLQYRTFKFMTPFFRRA